MCVLLSQSLFSLLSTPKVISDSTIRFGEFVVVECAAESDGSATVRFSTSGRNLEAAPLLLSAFYELVP